MDDTKGPGTPGESGEIVIGEEAQQPAAADGALVKLHRELSEIVTPVEFTLNHTLRIIANSVRPVVLERYRRLRTKLIQEGVGSTIRSVMIASAGPEEGKTLTTINVALSFAMLSPLKVVVIDGDLRRGSIGQWLGVQSECPGIGNLLEGTARLDEVVKKSDQLPVHFIFAGNSAAAPGELLEPNQLRMCMRQLAQYFDLIIIDSPPVNLITDAQLLAQASDGIMLVTRAYSTKRSALEKAIHDLQGHRILGAILNAGGIQRDYGNNYY